MKKIILLFIFLSAFKINAQIIIDESNLRLEFIKTKKVSNLVHASNVYYKSKDLKRIRVKVNMKYLNNKRQLFDPNKFSLIDHNSKLRYRPTDILYQNLSDWQHFKKISKTKPKKKSNKHIYYPDIDDTFLDYEFDGIKNVQIPINFNTKRKPDIHIIHFMPRKLRVRNIHVFFILSKELNNASIYYENKKIEDINFK